VIHVGRATPSESALHSAEPLLPRMPVIDMNPECGRYPCML
jgi:hypothetical protein